MGKQILLIKFLMNRIIKFCVKLRNASNVRSSYLYVKNDKLILNFLRLLYQQGFICGVEKSNNFLKIILKYNSLLIPTIRSIIIISSSNNVIYVNYKVLSKLLKLDDFFIFSSDGILTGRKVIKKKIGGQLVCSLN